MLNKLGQQSLLHRNEQLQLGCEGSPSGFNSGQQPLQPQWWKIIKLTGTTTILEPLAAGGAAAAIAAIAVASNRLYK